MEQNNAEKLRKKAIRDQQKRFKPGECQKYVRLVLDSALLTAPWSADLLAELNCSQLKYEVRKLPESNCIIWERSAGQHTLTASSTCLDAEWKVEKQVVHVLSSHKLQSSLKATPTVAERLHASFPGMRHTLLLLRGKEKLSNAHDAALVEMQVMQELAAIHQVPERACEIVALLQRFTKAIAEAPYKQSKSDTLDNFKKFLANDKKQCVRVVGTNGFGRLWQQHLNRLPLVTLEVAETIIAKYSCPKALLDEFASNEDAPNALAELRIQRAGGAMQTLQAERRIGNVLSNKLHTLYTTRDPNALI